MILKWKSYINFDQYVLFIKLNLYYILIYWFHFIYSWNYLTSLNTNRLRNSEPTKLSNFNSFNPQQQSKKL